MNNHKLSKSNARSGKTSKRNYSSSKAIVRNVSGKSIAISASDLANVRTTKKKAKVSIRVPVQAAKEKILASKPLVVYDLLSQDERNELNTYETKISNSVTPIGVFINRIKASNLLNTAKKRHLQNDAHI